MDEDEKDSAMILRRKKIIIEISINTASQWYI
ncbi:predicted protein [Sclerotinia sclerotiorum 1980 UF-70]|uniref:Uncharacterized protein n=1 Tax=Sclerotinia sclerotiorum (strain ATCC 18683 / 1980 / Ss-1) TaxID=665079 RepID=A7EV24_SCLS1|nr:predicted protein [Sclerotinia sclerotiorum 1980 UF-70]EDN93316.1 predicted protein [Sclerotinia sclerotiorum 1980 UF-70]